MSSRAEQKQRLKQERLEAEAAERARAARKRRLGVLGGLAVLAVAIVVVVLVVSGGGSKGDGVKETANVSLFEGIPQSGVTLGQPDAPVTVEEYLDLQCPVCMRFSQSGLDVLVNDYVKTGKVKLVMRPINIIGDDSVTAALTVLSAAKQDKAWPFAETFYANQGVENSGYVTDAFLDKIAKATPGLDAKAALSGRNADAVVKQFDATAERSQVLGVNGTPTFVATKGGGKPKTLDIQASNPSSVNTALDPIVGSSD